MKYIFTILFICILAVGSINAQGLIEPELPPLDSALVNDSLLIPDAPLLNMPVTPELWTPEMGVKTYKLPHIDFDDAFLNFRQDYNYYIYNPQGTDNLNIPFAAMPFISSGAIFNQAAYKLSDKITVGGNSFGANSIFSTPLPNSGFNNFDYRGASMFFQYKVSKNIKIETRVSVTNSQH